MNEQPKCQCQERAIDMSAHKDWYEPPEYKAMLGHEPGECLGDYNMRLVQRGEHQIWICSCCSSWGDVPITDARGLTAIPHA